MILNIFVLYLLLMLLKKCNLQLKELTGKLWRTWQAQLCSGARHASQPTNSSNSNVHFLWKILTWQWANRHRRPHEQELASMELPLGICTS